MPSKDKTRRAGNFGEEQRDGLKIGNQAPFEADTCIDSITHYTVEQLARGADVLAAAEEWREANTSDAFPAAWNYIERRAYEIGAAGRRINAQRLIEEVRARDFYDANGEPSRVNNSWGPVFARWLFSEHMELAHLFELRASVFDVLVLGEENGEANDAEQR